MGEYRTRAKKEFGARTPRTYAIAAVLVAVWVVVSLGFVLLLVELF